MPRRTVESILEQCYTEQTGEWTVYIARTTRSALYCGIAKDVAKRLRKHNSSKGSKCLRGQLPVVLVWHSPRMTHSEALSTEYKIKVMGRQSKAMLVAGQLEIYKTVNNGWGFALPGVLTILKG